MDTYDIYAPPERSTQSHEHPVAHLPFRGAHSLCQIGFRIEGTLRHKNSLEIESSKDLGLKITFQDSGFRHPRAALKRTRTPSRTFLSVGSQPVQNRDHVSGVRIEIKYVPGFVFSSL